MIFNSTVATGEVGNWQEDTKQEVDTKLDKSNPRITDTVIIGDSEVYPTYLGFPALVIGSSNTVSSPNSLIVGEYNNYSYSLDNPIHGIMINGYSNRVSANYTHAEGYYTEANGYGAHSEGDGTHANGMYSHAEGVSCQATGEGSHAEGTYTLSQGRGSHSEGTSTHALGQYSHTEGYGCNAFGEASHSEGYNCQAKGQGSHAEGLGTFANGNYSHSSGYNTTANGDYQFVCGRNNIASDQYAFVVGNGIPGCTYSNALTLDWNGSLRISGAFYDITGKSIGNGGALPEIMRNFGYRFLDEPTNLTFEFKSNSNSVKICWTDPSDITTSEPCTAVWAGTAIVKKVGMPPLSRWDGTLLEEYTGSSNKNKYQTTPFEDEIESNDTPVYYGIFPFDNDGLIKHYRWTKTMSTADCIDYHVFDDMVIGSTYFRFTYKLSKGADGYSSIKLYYKKNSEEEYTIVDADYDGYRIYDLEPNTQYDLRFRIIDNEGYVYDEETSEWTESE